VSDIDTSNNNSIARNAPGLLTVTSIPAASSSADAGAKPGAFTINQSIFNPTQYPNVFFSSVTSGPSQAVSASGSLADLNILISALSYGRDNIQENDTDTISFNFNDLGQAGLVPLSNTNEGGSNGLSVSFGIPVRGVCDSTRAATLNANAAFCPSLDCIRIGFGSFLSISNTNRVIAGCVGVFSEASFALLNGSTSSSSLRCVFEKRDELTVYFAKDAAVKTGDVLTLNSTNQIFKLCTGTASTVFTTGSVTIINPVYTSTQVSTFRPEVNIVAPAQIGVCDSLFVYATLTKGVQGNQPLKYYWSSSHPSILNGVTTSTSFFTVPSASLNTGITYYIYLIVENFVGLVSSKAQTIVVKSSASIPILTPLSPATVSIKPNQPTKLQVRGVTSSCTTDQIALNYAWALIPAPSPLPIIYQ